MYDKWINLIMTNFSLAMLILALGIAIIDWPIQVFRHKATTFEVFYRWIAILALGITGLYAFVMHAFFSQTAAAAIGWQVSPFQFEVAMANLGFGMIAILSFSASFGFRAATVVGNTLWLWGDAVGHIRQMIINHNYAIGNAGSWLWTDLAVPLVLIICIMKMRPKPQLPAPMPTQTGTTTSTQNFFGKK